MASQNSATSSQQSFTTVTVGACSLCGTPLNGSGGLEARSFWGDRELYEVVRCQNCSLGHTQPRPTSESIPLLYENKDYGVASMAARDFDPDQSGMFNRLKDYLARRDLRHALKGRYPSRALDYGAGNGRFANALSAISSGHVTAVDYQPERPLGLSPETRYETVTQFAEGHDKYDLIFLRHVLEHSEDPVALLKVLASHLTNDGRLYVEVPNLDSALRRIFGKNWVGFYVPHHIHHFTKESLALALDQAGLLGSVQGGEMPFMGNQLATVLGAKSYTLPYKLAGVILHPIQLIAERIGHSSGVIKVWASQKSHFGRG